MIVVGVSVGLKYEHYGDPEQGLYVDSIFCYINFVHKTISVLFRFSCWISVNEGLIWAFVAPMLAIIVVSCELQVTIMIND